MQDKIKIVVGGVQNLLANEKSGHDITHAMRVYQMALRFCRDVPSANVYIVALVAWLHDCDDRKVFGDDAAQNLPNATRIMRDAAVSNDDIDYVRNIIRSISFNKRMSGKMPISVEGEIVADADMCDAIGATGIIRCVQFGAAKGLPFFNPDVLPSEFAGDQYVKFGSGSMGVNHFFEKLLRIKDFCLTVPGRAEAHRRHQIMIDFLEQFFIENNAPQVWRQMLDKYRAR